MEGSRWIVKEFMVIFSNEKNGKKTREVEFLQSS